MGFDLNKISPALMKRIVESENAGKKKTACMLKQLADIIPPQAMVMEEYIIPTPKYLAGEERKLQQDCENYLRQRDIFYLRMPFGKATGLKAGFPDFVVFGRWATCLLIEMKAGAGKLSDDQKKLHAEYQRQTGQMVHVVTSFEDFVFLVKRDLLPCNACATPQIHSTSPPAPKAS